MNKAELIEEVHAKSTTGTPKSHIEKAVNDALGIIGDALAKGEKVVLVNFGTFEPVNRKPRKGRNPRTGNPIDIPAYKTVTFKAGKGLKESL